MQGLDYTRRMDFVSVRSGWFWMGWDAGHASERPPHRVWTGAFDVSRTPVTNREYAPFLAASHHPSPQWWTDPRFDHPDQPVVGVSWDDAVAYCEWRTGKSRIIHRLPTEAEWEKAARGGLCGARFPWGDDRPTTSMFDRPALVTETPANPIGLFALSGVCHEWCSDWEAGGYYARSPEENPKGPSIGTRRVSRGGAWRHQDPWSPVAHRSSLPPGLCYSDYGFRVVREHT